MGGYGVMRGASSLLMKTFVAFFALTSANISLSVIGKF